MGKGNKSNGKNYASKGERNSVSKSLVKAVRSDRTPLEVTLKQNERVEERTEPVDHSNKPQLFRNEPQIHQGAGAAGMEVEGFVVVEGTSPIFFSMDREGAVAFVAALNRLASPPNVKIKSLSVSGRPKGKSLSRTTRMTEYSIIPQQWVDWCRENYPDVDYHSEFDRYCNWSQSSPNGAKKDHFAAFRNWTKRRADEQAKKNPESKTMSVLRVLRDV